jgi:predicted esterase
LAASSAGAEPQATALPPLQAAWLERLGSGEHEIVVTPPVGTREPRPLVVGVHGAGDRPEWSCGGWRLGAQVSAFIACPHGSPQGHDRYAWRSSEQLSRGVDRAVEQTRARFGAYVSEGPLIYAGFSQGASLAEPLLLAQAARFPIAILAEGGYATARSPAFARAYSAAGGRRVVLVCGSPACFRSAKLARKALESAGLQVLVVGDEKAGHNLNQRMQQALQNAWPEIAAPLPGDGEKEHEH